MDSYDVIDAYQEAARCGDVEASKCVFKQPEMLAMVADWNAAYRISRLQGAIGDAVDSQYLLYPITVGQAEVARWLFAREQVDLLGETLLALVTHHLSEYFRSPLPAHEVAEIIFESPLFMEDMTHRDRHATLELSFFCGF